MSQHTIIPLAQGKNGAYDWPYIDTLRLEHFHVHCISNVVFDNDGKSGNLDGYRMQITLMDAETMLFMNSISVYANFTKSNKASNGIRRAANTMYKYAKYYQEQIDWFKTLIDNHKITVHYSNGSKRQKTPTYYTCPIRVSGVRKSVDKGCGIMIMDENDQPKVFAVALGKLRYVFTASDMVLNNDNGKAELGRKMVDIVDCIDYEDALSLDFDITDALVDDLLESDTFLSGNVI